MGQQKYIEEMKCFQSKIEKNDKLLEKVRKMTTFQARIQDVRSVEKQKQRNGYMLQQEKQNELECVLVEFHAIGVVVNIANKLLINLVNFSLIFGFICDFC